MADQQKLYNFYRRYAWNENDFEGWQTGMVGLARGVFEGFLGPSCLRGLAVSISGNLTLTVTAGIAVGSAGYLHVLEEQTSVAVTVNASSSSRNLLVLRKLLVDGDNIANPVSPFQQVPLTTTQSSQLVVIKGTESSTPDYPTGLLQEDDVVLMGFRLSFSQVVLTTGDLDTEARDLPGKTGELQQDQGKFDDRFRAYRSASGTLGIKPSQLEPPRARVFSYVNKTQPSRYPRNGSALYNGASGDSFYNFNTGAVTGADQLTGTITTIPASSAGVFRTATISVDESDKIWVDYGPTVGTRAQCLDGISQQKTSGAGSVTLPNTRKLLAFCILAYGTTNVCTEVDVIDARGMSSASTASTLTTLGDVQSHNGTDPVRVPGNTANTPKFLKQRGTGSVSALPSFESITAADVALQGIINFVTNHSALINTSGWALKSGSTGSLTRDTSASQPRFTSSGGVGFRYISSATDAADYVYNRFIMDDADRDQLGKMIGAFGAAGSNFRLGLYVNAAVNYSGAYSLAVPLISIPAANVNTVQNFTVPTNPFMELRVEHAVASAESIYFNTIGVGPIGDVPTTTLGDTIYGGTRGVPSRLAGNITTTRKFLRQTGTGSGSAAPAWDTPLADDVPGRNIEIWLSSGNANGSTRTFWRRYGTVTRNNSGAALQLTQSAANGDSITILKAGVYALSMSEDSLGASDIIGITLNDTNTLFQFTSTNALERIAQFQVGASGIGSCAVTMHLAVNDVVRVHTQASPPAGTAGQFRIVQVSQD